MAVTARGVANGEILAGVTLVNQRALSRATETKNCGLLRAHHSASRPCKCFSSAAFICAAQLELLQLSPAKLVFLPLQELAPELLKQVNFLWQG